MTRSAAGRSGAGGSGAGHEVAIVWNGRRARAWVPAPLEARDLTLDAVTAASTARAASEVGFAAEALDATYEPLARLLLRSEGVASSFIEGVAAPVVDIVLAESQPELAAGPAGWVASNMAAVRDAVADAAAGTPLSVEVMCRWHRTLMTGSPLPERHVGVVRDEQGWIGGTSPLDAQLVTPPPETVPALLDDLVAYTNRSDVDPVAQAAVAHAQFELIHPFADGNGRIGRILVAWLLTRTLSLVVPPPVSVSIAADVGGYASGLVLFRMGQPRPWIRWFADAVGTGARAQRALGSDVERILARWRQRLSSLEPPLRTDSTANAALELIPRHLVLTSRTVVDELGVSRKTAVATLARLAAAGILTQHGTSTHAAPGQPAKLYVAQELLGLAGSNPLR